MADIGSTLTITQKQGGVRSLSKLFGAAAPAAAFALVYCSLFLLLRRVLPDVYDPKRRRLKLLKTLRTRHVKGVPDKWKPGETSDADSKVLPSDYQPEPPDPPMVLVLWVRFIWSMNDSDILRYLGSDAYMFLRFLRMGVKVTLILSVVVCGFLFPIHIRQGVGMKDLDQLSLSNVPDRSSELWAHFAATYVVSFFAMLFLYIECRTYVDLRQRYLRSHTAQTYSIIVRDIPYKMNHALIREYIQAAIGDDVLAVHSADSTIRRIRYEQIVTGRDNTIIGLERAYETQRRLKKRPRHFSLWKFRLVDSIDHLNNRLQNLNKEIRRLNDEYLSADRVGCGAVVTLDSIRAASAFRLVPFQQGMTVMSVSEAPPPDEVLWVSVTTPAYIRLIRTVLVWCVVLLLILTFTIPVSFVASLSNLKDVSAQKGFTWLKPIVNFSRPTTLLIQGFLPPLLLSLLFSLVPWLMKYLTTAEMSVSDAAAERGAIVKVFLFTVVDVFLAYTLAGTFFSKLKMLMSLARHPEYIIPMLALTLPAQSTFFITYIILGTLSGLSAELFRLGPLILYGIKRCFCLRNGAFWDHLTVMTQLKGFNVLYCFPLMVFLLTLCYAVPAPLIIPFGLAYYTCAYTTWLHQLLYVYQPTTHTGASQWPAVFSCCMTALLFSQALMVGILTLKRATWQSTFLLPLFIFSIVLWGRMRRVLHSISSAATLDNVMHTGDAEPKGEDRKMLKLAYDPFSVKGINDILSSDRLGILCEPYGILYHGVVTDSQRDECEDVNLTPTGLGPDPQIVEMLKKRISEPVYTEGVGTGGRFLAEAELELGNHLPHSNGHAVESHQGVFGHSKERMSHSNGHGESHQGVLGHSSERSESPAHDARSTNPFDDDEVKDERDPRSYDEEAPPSPAHSTLSSTSNNQPVAPSPAHSVLSNTSRGRQADKHSSNSHGDQSS